MSNPIPADDYCISIVIPCYNEIHTIASLVRAVRESTIARKEIIIVDDFSVDGTREVLKEKIEKSVDKVVYHARNLGKGAALRTAIKAATGDIVIVQDADLEYDPNDFPRLIEPILRHGADVVYGSRFMGSGAHRAVYFWHMVANRTLTLISNMVTNINLTDMMTGYKAFRRDVIQAIVIEENGFGCESEITVKLARRHAVFYEVGISYHGRTYAQGKKIRVTDAFRSIYVLIKLSFLSS
jgi:glycosyltransferase involved in cell wall biosynthesis